MKKYRVVFEMFIHPEYIFHPCYIVQANNIEEAKEKGQESFNSQFNNVESQREIVNVQEIKEEQ